MWQGRGTALKYSWSRACWAVILLLGLSSRHFSIKSIPCLSMLGVRDSKVTRPSFWRSSFWEWASRPFEGAVLLRKGGCSSQASALSGEYPSSAWSGPWGGVCFRQGREVHPDLALLWYSLDSIHLLSSRSLSFPARVPALYTEG